MTVGKVLNVGSHGVTRDSKAAYHYLKRAADGGDAEAMAHLGESRGWMGGWMDGRLQTEGLFKEE